MLKFRSMVETAEDDLAGLLEHNEGAGVLFKMQNDPRVTGVGRWMRKHSLDELPQFFKGTSNVHLARKYNLVPIGTMAHEYLQAFQAFPVRLRDFQKAALEDWVQEYRGDLGTALPSDSSPTDRAWALPLLCFAVVQPQCCDT